MHASQLSPRIQGCWDKLNEMERARAFLS